MPFIFITTSKGKIMLRDLVQDLNQEMNFDEIVMYFYKSLVSFGKKKPKTNSERYISNVVKIHSKKQLLIIIEMNLKRLEVQFSHLNKAAIAGNWGEDWPLYGKLHPAEYLWYLLLKDDDNDDNDDKSSEEGLDDPDNDDFDGDGIDGGSDDDDDGFEPGTDDAEKEAMRKLLEKYPELKDVSPADRKRMAEILKQIDEGN